MKSGQGQVIAEWREEYNQERPHSSLGYLTRNSFADRFFDPTPINGTGGFNRSVQHLYRSNKIWRCAVVSVYGAMTHDRKARIWQLWRRGQPMSEIARDIQKPSATVYSYLLYHGGITPRPRVRRPGCLSHEEREAISRGLARSQSIRSIARELGRVPSIVSREISRNGGIGKYRACTAEESFLKRSKRPKT